MRRLFWMGVGAGAGIYAFRKVTKVAEAATPAGLTKSIESLGTSLRYFADEVRAGMTEREDELNTALGLNSLETGSPPHNQPHNQRRLGP